VQLQSQCLCAADFNRTQLLQHCLWNESRFVSTGIVVQIEKAAETAARQAQTAEQALEDKNDSALQAKEIGQLTAKLEVLETALRNAEQTAVESNAKELVVVRAHQQGPQMCKQLDKSSAGQDQVGKHALDRPSILPSVHDHTWVCTACKTQADLISQLQTESDRQQQRHDEIVQEVRHCRSGCKCYKHRLSVSVASSLCIVCVQLYHKLNCAAQQAQEAVSHQQAAETLKHEAYQALQEAQAHALHQEGEH
jgi:hypothetical protein